MGRVVADRRCLPMPSLPSDPRVPQWGNHPNGVPRASSPHFASSVQLLSGADPRPPSLRPSSIDISAFVSILRVLSFVCLRSLRPCAQVISESRIHRNLRHTPWIETKAVVMPYPFLTDDCIDNEERSEAYRPTGAPPIRPTACRTPGGS